MNSEGLIQLEGMEFHAYHGCLEREKTAGNLFVVDFEGRLDMAEAAASDRLEDALDYSLIYNIVSEQMKYPSNLLENVASRIVRSIEIRFPQISEFSVRVSKSHPPVDGVCAWSRITLFSKR